MTHMEEDYYGIASTQENRGKLNRFKMEEVLNSKIDDDFSSIIYVNIL